MNRITKVVLALGAAVAVLTMSGCSTSAASDVVYVHKGNGPFESKSPKGCVQPGQREINGAGDDYFAYPASQRFYDFMTNAKQGDGDPFTVVSKDGQQLTVTGQVFFTLNTDCDTLQLFHDKIGNRMKAYMDGDNLSPGWSDMLNLLFRQPIDTTLDVVAKKYTWQQLRSDIAVKDEMAKAVDAALKNEINEKIAGDGDFFVNYSTQIQQPIAPKALVEQIEAAETSKAQAAATEAKAKADAAAAQAAATAQVTQKEAELKVAEIEAKIQQQQIKAYGGADAYIKWQAVQKGINPWQPTYSNQLVQP